MAEARRLPTGKAPATFDPRDALFTAFATVSKLPKIPAKYGHQAMQKAPWGMLGNGPDDSVEPGFQGAGDCVFAGADHETMLWNVEAGRAVRFTGRNTIDDYSAVTGYRIGYPGTDNGTNVRDALNWRRRTGLGDAQGHRHKLGAFVQLEPGHEPHVRAATYLLSAVGIGFQVPESIWPQFDAGQPWTVVAGAQIEGGHYVPVVGFSPAGVFVVTWGKVQLMTWPFFHTYCDEAYGLLSPEFLKAGKSPEGFDLKALTAWLPQVQH